MTDSQKYKTNDVCDFLEIQKAPNEEIKKRLGNCCEATVVEILF